MELWNICDSKQGIKKKIHPTYFLGVSSCIFYHWDQWERGSQIFKNIVFDFFLMTKCHATLEVDRIHENKINNDSN